MDDKKLGKEDQKQDKKEDKKEKHSCEEEILKKEDQIGEYKLMLQRLQADFENYKKREERDSSEKLKYAPAHIISKLLPVIDSFEMAMKNKNSDGEKFKKGMELVYAQLHSVLKEEGIEKIPALGQKFDPHKHEVLMQEESEKEDQILEEFQTGYMFKDRVLRHSKVKIGVKKNG